jgi:hypothetical protein
MKEAKTKTAVPMITLQCRIPLELMTRLRVAAARRNRRSIRPDLVEALDAYLPKEDPEPKRPRT